MLAHLSMRPWGALEGATGHGRGGGVRACVCLMLESLLAVFSKSEEIFGQPTADLVFGRGRGKKVLG